MSVSELLEYGLIYWLILEDIGLILTLFKIFISEFATSCSSIKVRLQYSGAEMSCPVISFLNTVGGNKNKFKNRLDKMRRRCIVIMFAIFVLGWEDVCN